MVGTNKKKRKLIIVRDVGWRNWFKNWKIINKNDIPRSLFVIFTFGCNDFVDVFVFYQFLKNSFNQSEEPAQGKSFGKDDKQELENWGKCVFSYFLKTKRLKSQIIKIKNSIISEKLKKYF